MVLQLDAQSKPLDKWYTTMSVFILVLNTRRRVLTLSSDGWICILDLRLFSNTNKLNTGLLVDNTLGSFPKQTSLIGREQTRMRRYGRVELLYECLFNGLGL